MATAAKKSAPTKKEATITTTEATKTYGEILFSNAESNRKGTPSEYVGQAFIKSPSDNRKGGIGKRILDFLISGETYEELKARLVVAVREGTLDIPSIYIRNHLDYDLKYKNTTLVPYIDKKKRTLVDPLDSDLVKAREENGLPPLNS
jgi:hypothetical protein